eukprot:snap_masked-scaffold_36-processed-gene-0.43-mRNA-1 protein AED:0.03 eAED:0.03 QI:0/-1/0/1/-1/1/1/0/189
MKAAKDFVDEQLKEVKYVWNNKRTLTMQFLNLCMVVSSALMLWKGLGALTNTESPVVVVLTGSMLPGIERGDILALDNNYDTPLRVGEIVVFQIDERDIPIVHRLLWVHEKEENSTKGAKYLTKGDNNNVDDRGLYAPGQMWLKREEIIGRVRFVCRKMGMITIWMNDYPALKYILLGSMAYFVITNKE